MTLIFRHNSKEGAKSPLCLCNYITPIFKLAQVIGITAGSFGHTETHIIPIVPTAAAIPYFVKKPGGSNHAPNNKGLLLHCTLSTKWKSFPSLINILLSVYFLSVNIWMSQNIEQVLTVYFDGTDLYAFGVQIISMFTQTSIIVLNTMIRRGKLSEMWLLMQIVYFTLAGDEGQKVIMDKELKRLKVLCYFLVAWILGSGTYYGGFFFKFVFAQCFSAEADPEVGREISGKPVCPLTGVFLTLQKIGYTLLIFYNQGVADLFVCFCILIWVLNRRISACLEGILEEGDRLGDCRLQSKAGEIEKLRILHEKLCTCGRLIGDFFGVPLLCLCVTCLYSITCGVYTAFLRGVIAMETESKNGIGDMYVLVAIHGVIGSVILGLVLFTGQMVKTSAERPSLIIAGMSHSHMNAEEKHQLVTFQQKLGPVSCGISACNVTTIGMSFLAAAATNVTTYILVILQFRLGVEPQTEEPEALNANSTFNSLLRLGS